MGLDENAKAANLVGSGQQYAQDQLAGVLNSSQDAVDYGGGLPFKDSDLDRWVQFRMLGPVRPDALQGPFAGRAAADPNSRGAEVYWLINVNCFVRPAKLPSFDNLALWKLRDAVLEAFREGTLIPVKDYGDTGETIGNLFVDTVMEDRAVYDPAREDLLQHNLVFRARWTETWSA